ncbi:MAG: acetyl ornithine aminotransferase family protein [Candidatus Bathyarchaeota archaeon]|jgi:4-aminobutyrate aminotransferase|nr:acetyl ornithine aminotransferase family protein [Candidatus Bathyarchaeota archaeon]
MSDYPKIVATPPGPKARELAKRDERVISQSFVRWYPLAIQSARGCIIRDVDGNEYVDFNSGLVCLNVGHNHPRVIEAVKDQLDRFLHYSITDFMYREVVDVAEKLVEITPGGWRKKVFFCNSGAEAVEAGAKLARWHTRRPRFIAFIGAFHGRTFGGMSFTASKPVQRRYFSPLVPGVTHVPYGYCYRCPFKLTYPDCSLWCIDFIEDEVLQKYVPPEEVAAFIFEPIQGEGGYVVPPDGYFERLKKLAVKHGILMMDDEVQAGMGRTGKWFAIENWGVKPDVVCIAKSIAAGLPLGAMVAKATIMDWEGGSHASTFGGNPVSCAAASAVINIIQNERLKENAIKQGAHIMKRLEELKRESEIVGDVRGKGLMIGIELVKDKTTKKPASEKATEVMRQSWRRGVAVITCGKSTIRIAPPLTMSRELVDAGLDIVLDAIRQVEQQG